MPDKNSEANSDAIHDANSDERGAAAVLEMIGGVALAPDQACFQLLHWRMDVPAADIAAVLARLQEAGFIDESFSSLLRIVREPRVEHTVVLVPATGRLQLRVAPTTAREARHAEARRIAHVVVGAAARTS